MQTLNWTQISDDPISREVLQPVTNELKRLRKSRSCYLSGLTTLSKAIPYWILALLSTISATSHYPRGSTITLETMPRTFWE